MVWFTHYWLVTHGRNIINKRRLDKIKSVDGVLYTLLIISSVKKFWDIGIRANFVCTGRSTVIINRVDIHDWDQALAVAITE